MYYGEKVILRSLELSDVEEIMKRFNTLELRQTLGGQLPASFEDEVEWVKNTWKERRDGTGYEFCITDLDSNFLGTGGLFSISQLNRSARLGIALHDPAIQRRGYGTDAVKVLCAFAFRVLNLHRVQLEYIKGNMGYKAYVNVGFTEVGRHRDAIYNLGTYKDLIVMDILENEFHEKCPQYTLFQRNN